MKNYWLDQKNKRKFKGKFQEAADYPCNKRWKRFELPSTCCSWVFIDDNAPSGDWKIAIELFDFGITNWQNGGWGE